MTRERRALPLAVIACLGAGIAGCSSPQPRAFHPPSSFAPVPACNGTWQRAGNTLTVQLVAAGPVALVVTAYDGKGHALGADNRITIPANKDSAQVDIPLTNTDIVRVVAVATAGHRVSVCTIKP